MKLIKIDPWAKTITAIDTDTMPELAGMDRLEKLQSLVTRGSGGLVELLVKVTPTMDLIGDEEANLKEDRAFFSFDTMVFTGIGLLIGVEETEDGKEWRGLRGDTACMIEMVKRQVTFPDPAQVFSLDDEPGFTAIYGEE